jgi:hypothetical protein
MNFLNRRMFQEGGDAASLGPYQIRDKLTGEIIIDLSDQPNFINQVGFNPYKILNDDTLEKGSAVLSILQQFQKRDAPQIGPFQAQEDLGTNLVDLGFSALRGTEPFIRGGSRLLGETFGIQPLKEFGGKQEFDPSVGLGGIDLFKPTYDSYVPTDQERSRGMIGLLKQSKNLQNKVQNVASNPNVRSGTNMFFDALRSGDEKMSDYFGTDRIFEDRPKQQIQDFQSEIDGFVGPTRPGADVVDTAVVTETPRFESETLSLEGGPFDMETRRLAYQKEMIGRDEFGDLLPEGRLEKDDEIANLLEEIKPIEQKVDVDKTEADTLADNEAKFGGLSQDEFRATIDDAATPKLLEIERPITDTTIVEEETLRKQNDPVSRKLDQPGFFGSDRFLNFIRNVGGELVRTGQFGEGLASGAAKASEERAARELMADAEERDYLTKLRLVRAEADYEAQKKLDEGPSDSMRKELRTVAQEMNADYNDIVSAKSTLEVVGRVEDILYNTDTTSFKAFAGELLEKVGSFFDADGKPSESGKSFENLEPRTRAKVLLNQVKQKNIKSLLGENSKTISNLDRQIVEELVGSIALGKTPQETLEALKLTKESIYNSLSAAQTRLKSNFRFANAEGGLYLIQDNTKILDYLKTGILSNTYDNSYENQSIRKITLKE